jgi:hypothetical protein
MSPLGRHRIPHSRVGSSKQRQIPLVASKRRAATTAPPRGEQSTSSMHVSSAVRQKKPTSGVWAGTMLGEQKPGGEQSESMAQWLADRQTFGVP